ncbi:sulfonate transport system substrate-binding protein [Bradyrhizobium sp. Rc2d]|uniref:ABC transporter substrate-binding protein n=1 Tax=Bradyrhizobium sp. Rc2d TaxID=1855321 RepID=UPI000880ECDB|nr:ABC transporter substrate-binding protein [Bradyrhizobium sp. Rc2d]SDG42610.1 sulfonate transport system substrate-binding protein [Bradyrhizobium sp. Rc2d]
MQLRNGDHDARKRRSVAPLMLLGAASLAAVMTAAPAISQDTADLPAQLAAAVPPRTKLVVAEQQSQASAPWTLSGVDRALPYAITFANFNGGPAVLEALISGAVDIGYIGEAPLPIAVGAGVRDLVAIAIYANPGSPENYYLVAQPDKGIKTVADLKGRTVAYPPGSGRHMVLASILHSNGLDLGASSVRGVPLAGTEVAPSFASRSVDAAIVLGGQYFRIGKPPIIADGRGHNWGVNVILTRKALLDDRAKAPAIADFVRRAVAFYNWQDVNRDAWIRASYVKQEGLTFDQGKWLDDAAGHGAYYPIDAKAVRVFQEISDRLFATGALKQKIDIAPYLDGRFNAIIAWQNNADSVTPRPLEQPKAAVTGADQ